MPDDMYDMKNLVDAFKIKIAILTGEAVNQYTAFNILSSRWKTLVEDIKEDLKSNVENGKVPTEVHDALLERLNFLHQNLSHANLVGLHDVTDSLKPNTASSGLAPAAIAPLVPYPSPQDVRIAENGSVVVDPVPQIEAVPSLVGVGSDSSTTQETTEATTKTLDVVPIVQKVEEIKSKLDEVEQDIKA